MAKNGPTEPREQWQALQSRLHGVPAGKFNVLLGNGVRTRAFERIEVGGVQAAQDNNGATFQVQFPQSSGSSSIFVSAALAAPRSIAPARPGQSRRSKVD